MASEISGISIFYLFVQGQIKENIKARVTGDRWIPRTKGQ